MPRQDGTLTAAEQRTARRVADNARYLREASDEELARIAADELNMSDAVTAEQVRTELARRAT